MNKTRIIPATPVMASSLVELSQTLGYKTVAKEVTQRVKGIISKDDHILLVAQVNDKVVGFCHGYVRLLIEVPIAVEIGGLAVNADYQGHGLGRKLVTGIEKWTKDKNISQIVLSSNVIRQAAHEFYEHLGYKKTKQQFVFKKNL